MPIKWSALSVSQAMDKVEGYVNQAAEPLEQAKADVNKARTIANLPQYLDQRITRLLIDIDRIEYIKSSITTVRNELPKGALESEKKAESFGQQPELVM